MQPVSWDDKFVRGDGFRMGFRLAHLDANGNKVYDYNFTGWTGLAQLRRTVDHSVVLLTFTVTIPDQTANPGLVWVTATGAQTATVTEESGVYDVQLTPPAGEPMTIARGRLAMIKDVSRP